MKRIVACFLALIMCLTSVELPTMVIAAEPEIQQDAVIASEQFSDGVETQEEFIDPELEAIDSIGQLIAAGSSGETGNVEKLNAVTSLLVEDSVATVEYQAETGADLVVAVYDETTMQMLASGTIEVPAGSGEAEVVIEAEGELPKYFVAAAYLLEKGNHEPLCEEYATQYYTKQFQEFLSKDSASFEDSLVVDLDGDQGDNYAVYKNDVIIIHETDGVNQIQETSGGIFTITNTDSKTANLHAGDIISYIKADGNTLLIKVKSAQSNGATVTIEEDPEIVLKDVFDYLKIEVAQTGSAVSGYSTLPAKETYNETLSVSLPVGITEGNVSLKGELGFLCNVEFATYVCDDMEYRLQKIDYQFSTTVSASGKIEKTFDLPEIKTMLIPCVQLSFTPAIKVQANAKLSWDGLVKGTIGYFAGEIKGEEFGEDLSVSPTTESEVNFTGTLFVGICITPAFNLFDSDFVSFRFVVDAGMEFEGKQLDSLLGAKNSKHECKSCIDGEVYMKFEVEFEWTINDFVIDSLSLVASHKKKIGDFYYSIDFDEFDWTICPHYLQKITITVKDADNAMIPNVEIFGTGLAEPPVTNGNGEAVCYLPNGTYQLTLPIGTAVQQLIVEGEEKNVILKADVVKGTCGADLEWILDATGTLTIAGRGNMYDFTYGSMSGSSAPWYDHRSEIKKIIFPNEITSIGNYAFLGCGNLEGILELPDNITVIGTSGFAQCIGLTGLKLPKNLKEIKSYGFELCRNVTGELTLPEGLEQIGNQAFEHCAFTGNLVIPDSVKRISSWAFRENYGLTGTLTLGKGLEYIGEDAFAYCNFTGNIIIPDSVTAIAEGAFSENPGFTGDVMIPDSVISLGSHVFQNCTGLNGTVRLPSNITEIGNYLFQNCSGLTGVLTIPEGVTKIGVSAFENCSGFIGNLVIPDSVTSVMDSAFENCSGFNGTLKLSNSLTRIYHASFKGCTGIQGDLVIPEKVRRIESNAFDSAGLDGKVIIPASVTNMESEVFINCVNLKHAYFLGNAPTTGVDVFGSVGVTAHYPAGNTTWTTEKMAKYGDAVIWFSYDPAELTEEAVGENAGMEGVFSDGEGLEDIDIQIEDAVFEDTMEGIEVNNKENLISNADSGQNENQLDVILPETEFKEDEVQAEQGDKKEVRPEMKENTDFEESEDPEVKFENPLEESETSGMEIFLDGVEECQGEPETPIDFLADIDGQVEAMAYFAAEPATKDGKQVAIFDNLTPGAEYVLVAVKDSSAEKMFNADNLLFIAQQAADENGNLAFAYLPKETIENAAVGIYGKTNKELSNAKITVESVSYNGKTQMPTVTVKYGNENLTEDLDYTVKYIDNINVGTGYATITGIGDYSGVVVSPFTIHPIYISETAIVLSQTSYAYDGTEKKPVATVTYNGATLKEGKDYTVSYQNNIIGTGKAVLTGMGNFKGTYTLSFTIKETSCSWGAWEITRTPTLTSTGRKKRICSVCGRTEYETIAKIVPTIKLNVGSVLPMKVGQYTNKVKASGLAEGDSIYKWTTSNSKIVAVNASTGALKAVGKANQSAVISIYLTSNTVTPIKKFTVKIQAAAVGTSKITGLSSKITLAKGKKTVLKPSLYPVTAVNKITYATSNKNIAAVSSTGILLAKKAGTARITVRSGGKYFNVYVTVPKVKTTKITGLTSKLTIQKGKYYNLRPKAYPTNSDYGFTYTSSNKNVAYVYSNGRILARKAGTAKITVKSANVSFVVTVIVPKVKTTKIYGMKTAMTVSVGKLYSLGAKVYPANSDDLLTYATSNRNIVLVNSAGKIKGIRKGTAYITVKSGSVIRKCKIVVK